VQTDDRRVAGLIREATHIAVLTGAGISTTAGIPDFRGPRGLYVTRQYDPEKTFDITYFDRDPSYFFAFARDAVITQNIDGLHQRAGSKRVIEVHGSVRSGHCRKCGRMYAYEELKMKILREEIARCDACGGIVKPDIVFFGEAVQGMGEASAVAGRADLFFVIGSSLTVYPAASLPGYAGGQVVVVNQGPVEMATADWLCVDEAADSFFARVAPVLGLSGIG
jgi:NAD-dependent deacetylase